MYFAHDLGRAFALPIHTWASMLRTAWTHPFNPASVLPPVRALAAAAELVERATAMYPKPSFGLETTVIDAREVAVHEQLVHETPFCRLLHFERDVTRHDPRVLIVAPLSGHHATLLRETVRELLPDHDLYITDWVDARMVPLSAGKFDLADYVDLLIAHLRELGPDVHVLSVCQPAVPVLVATAMLAEAEDPAQPASMVLISGPVDTRVNPSSVNQFARVHSLKSLEGMVIHRVPVGHPGSGRRVYPGILQLWSFMSLDPHRHVDAHVSLFKDVVKGELESADKRRRFYDEYFAVMDLPAEFYLETVQHVFHRHSLPEGKMLHRGKPVPLDAIRRTALMTVEGQDDDITTPGQTYAAHGLLSSVPAGWKEHHLQEGAGHYGTFSGRRFRERIAPRLRAFFRAKR
ncbi:MAG TPA: polyhydroxyalkanoate depolymerase [Myxococcaceae bacterium]|nr:polyhydroxyalkanoate depolymerase [Myxococcaceae bacterium]